MAASAHDRLADKTTIGSKVAFEGTVIGEVIDEVSRLNIARDYRDFLQRIQLCPQKANEMGSQYAYRWCYRAVGERDTVPFGQFALLLSEIQLCEMLAEARGKGWPI